MATNTIRIGDQTHDGQLKIGDGSQHFVILDTPSLSADATLTLPAVTATLATIGGTETLTGKTLTAPIMTTPTIGNGTSPGAIDLLEGSATGVNKVTLTIATNVAADRVVTIPSAGDVTLASLTGTETLTNKTLTSPVVNGATGTGGTFSGAVLSTGTAGVGYATGAGGTVTQLTNKSTGVTLSKTCGEITMDAAELGVDTIVSFTLTNTTIAATDVLILNHASGGTVGKYVFNAQCAAGSAVINVTNISAGALSEAVVIRFVVVKGVNA